MPNQEAILENIRKLMRLGLTGEDLLTQLEGMGIPRMQAEQWLAEAANPSTLPPARTTTPPPTPPTRTREPAYTAENEVSSSLLTSSMGTFTQEAARTENFPRPPRTPTPTPAYQAPAPGTSVEKLWEKGILATVDTKLAQMELLKKDIDSLLERKIRDHYAVMEKKLEALFDAQRELFKLKMDAQMDAKVKDVDDLLTQKIEEIRQINVSTKEEVQRLKGQKMVVSDVLQEINTKVATLEDTKRVISTDVARKLDELQGKVDELLETTDTRVKDVEARAMKTLELEEKITGGLTEQVQTQANTILEQRVKDLRDELKNEIITLKKLGADLASKDIQQTLNEFKTLNEEMTKTKAEMDGLLERKAREMDAMLEKKLLNVDKIVNTKMETLVNTKEKDFFKKVEDQSSEMATSKRDLAQKLIEAETTMQNLTMFQKQFVETLKKSNLERGDEAATFKKRLDAFEARADEKIQLMESRLRQLDAVVNQLSSLLSQWSASQGGPAIPTAPSTGESTIVTSGKTPPSSHTRDEEMPPMKGSANEDKGEKKDKKGIGSLFKKK